MSVGVLTLNLWHRSPPLEERLHLIRECVERLQPDVIGFQEALRGEGVDTASEIVEGLGYSVVFARACGFWEDGALDFGNAVASRWPVTDSETLPLPHRREPANRVALSATLAAPFGPVSFTCTHLEWPPHFGALRERQAVALCDFVAGRAIDGGYPSILVGDFNAEPDSDEIRYVTGKHSIDERSTYMNDAWLVAGAGDGTTFARRNPHARLMRMHDRRIDYLFVGYPTTGAAGAVEECRVVCDEAVDGVWPSDHFGVYARLLS